MEYFYKETGQINMETNNPQFTTYALYLNVTANRT